MDSRTDHRAEKESDTPKPGGTSRRTWRQRWLIRNYWPVGFFIVLYGLAEDAGLGPYSHLAGWPPPEVKAWEKPEFWGAMGVSAVIAGIAALHGTRKLSLSPEGVVAAHAFSFGRRSIPWEMLQRVVVGGVGDAVWICSGKHAIRLPRYEYGRAAFSEIVKCVLDTALERAPRAVIENGHICVKCGYDLRGIDREACPKCGGPVPLVARNQSVAADE